MCEHVGEKEQLVSTLPQTVLFLRIQEQRNKGEGTEIDHYGQFCIAH